jgi:hypothetical protein
MNCDVVAQRNTKKKKNQIFCVNMRTWDDIIGRNIMGPDGGLSRGLRGKCKIEKKL